MWNVFVFVFPAFETSVWHFSKPYCAYHFLNALEQAHLQCIIQTNNTEYALNMSFQRRRNGLLHASLMRLRMKLHLNCWRFGLCCTLKDWLEKNPHFLRVISISEFYTPILWWPRELGAFNIENMHIDKKHKLANIFTFWQCMHES